MRGVPPTIHKPLIDFPRNIKSCEKDDPFYPHLLFVLCITSNYVFIQCNESLFVVKGFVLFKCQMIAADFVFDCSPGLVSY